VSGARTDERLGAILARLPEAAKDLKLNLSAVLGSEHLTPAQALGTALAAAFAAGAPELAQALVDDAGEREDLAPLIDDARAAAALMAMNNVYYRFRHQVGKESYGKKPARLRMNRLGKAATNRLDLELFSLGVSAINGCERCVQSHEQTVTEAGLSEDAVHDVVRIAAVVNAVASTLGT